MNMWIIQKSYTLLGLILTKFEKLDTLGESTFSVHFFIKYMWKKCRS